MVPLLGAGHHRALNLLNMREVSAWTGRAYSTLMAYRSGDRRVTPDAARELIAYLHDHAESLTEAADKLEAALAKEEERDG